MCDYNIERQLISQRILNLNKPNIVSIQLNEIYDIIEDLLDDLKAIRQRIVRLHMNSHMIEQDEDYIVSTRVSKKLDTLWSKLDTDDADIYYMCKSDLDYLMNTDNDAISRSHAMLNLLYKGQYTVKEYNIQLSLEKAELVETSETHEAYMPLMSTPKEKHITLFDADKLTIRTNTVDHINNNCRIFKCKQCGQLTYIDRSNDQRMIRNGLKPVQRCDACLRERRFNRQNEKDNAYIWSMPM